ncbi:Peptidase family M23 [Amphibacillus marinus]|uniref:Peptidase family M23 n=1 Tax=Amphibacillus marinus TaxID=872970 RepID=A0A1H8MB24_9BACI|nr:peptidoglycan DD-metalloendopeptidase family protein [Amphibacillus marinus]SEO14346.1 Peptidase family M23 [Amphibacillus marinus]
MSLRKFRPRMLTFTIISNQAHKQTRQLYFPRILLVVLAIIGLIPIILLIYNVLLNDNLATTNKQLSEQVTLLENRKDTLVTEVEVLENERDTVIERFEQLNEIEEKFHQYINEMPEEALGGINIPLLDEEINQLSQQQSLLETTEWIDRYHQTIANIEQLEHNLQYIPTAWPTEPDTITSAFGPRSDPFNRTQSIHSGIDVRGATGTPVFAAGDGVVTLAEFYGGYGNTIRISHNDRYITLYAHLSEINVEQGEQVKKGSVIGAIGSTGRSTGPHLHYEILKDGTPVDPEFYLDFFEQE